MGKLYLIGIGGTGSRVIKSLMMLLASGVKLNVTEVVVLIIDPHRANDDLRRTTEILSLYRDINNELGSDREGSFFNTPVKSLLGEYESYTTQLDINDERFKEYIGYASMSEENQAFTKLLFSQKTLNVNMNIGFVGNPNIGSVVMNQFSESDAFRTLASTFQEQDRIFFINSIFGGTGAAGFPTLIKNIRNARNLTNIPNKDRIANAKIGGLTVLPYFGVTPDETKAINKADFIVKTRSALTYYNKNLSGSRSVINAHYTIGDFQMPEYDNDPGEDGQKNDAHFIEVSGAFSIVHYCNRLTDTDLEVSDCRPINPKFFEYGLNEDKQTLTFNDLDNSQRSHLYKAMIKFAMGYKIQNQYLESWIQSNEPFCKGEPSIDAAFLSTTFFQNYKRFYQHFRDWLDELERNTRSFKPFNVNSDFTQLINGVEVKRSRNPFAKALSMNTILSQLNKSSSKGYPTSPIKLVEVTNSSLETVVENYFPEFK